MSRGSPREQTDRSRNRVWSVSGRAGFVVDRSGQVGHGARHTVTTLFSNGGGMEEAWLIEAEARTEGRQLESELKRL
jgi:hypothetical protein